MEIMYVEITNTGNMQVRFTPAAAIPVYGRSADNPEGSPACDIAAAPHPHGGERCACDADDVL